MEVSQKVKLVEALAVTAEAMGTTLSDAAIDIMVMDLEGFEFNKVMAALTRCRREKRPPLTLAMIIELVSPSSGYLTANEAWALALPAADERNTVIWSKEAREAFNSVRPILDAGDKIGARMAFIAAYERYVDAAKLSGETPVMEVSAGWDKELHKVAVEQATIRGLLPPPKPPADQLQLPDLSPEQRKNNIDRLREIMDRAGAISREGGRIRRFDEAYRFEARQRELITQLGEQPEPVPDNEFQLLLTTKAACELLTAAADVKQLMFVLLGLCNNGGFKYDDKKTIKQNAACAKEQNRIALAVVLECARKLEGLLCNGTAG